MYDYRFLYANPYMNSPCQVYPYPHMSPYHYDTSTYSHADRQQVIKGQATWTTGGPVTKCGIPWSTNEYMTAAVGENTPYECGESIKVRNISVPGEREVIVTVVDRVAGYPPNRINLHRNAFVALGANPDIGVLNVEITPHPQLEEEKWGKYLLEVTQSAYPSYDAVDYQLIEKKQISPTQTRETYEFTLQSPRERIKVRGRVVYNPVTDRVISFDITEV